MKYTVLKLVINLENDPTRLEQFMNDLEGEVVSIIPNIARTSLLQIYGLKRKVDFVLIVEKK